MQSKITEEKGAIAAPVEICNRDIPFLTEIFCIMQDIVMLENRWEWHKERLFHITQHLTGMPGGGGAKDGLDEIFAILSELEQEDKERFRDYARHLRKAQRILNGIESRSMRTFVSMKYVMNVSDTEIRKELNMSRRGFARAKNAVETASCMADVKWQERFILTSPKNTNTTF